MVIWCEILTQSIDQLGPIALKQPLVIDWVAGRITIYARRCCKRPEYVLYTCLTKHTLPRSGFKRLRQTAPRPGLTLGGVGTDVLYCTIGSRSSELLR